MLGRPYHNDPGLNHSVLEEFQALGYPILSMRSLPRTGVRSTRSSPRTSRRA
jgi:predicted nucleotide-binding protein (sugar kinase/HSP70/actin superfamily)